MIIKLKHAPWMTQDWSGHPMTLILGFIFLILSALAVIISIDHPLYRNPRNPISDDRGRDQSVINSTRFLSFSWLSSLLLLLLLFPSIQVLILMSFLLKTLPAPLALPELVWPVESDHHANPARHQKPQQAKLKTQLQNLKYKQNMSIT